MWSHSCTYLTPILHSCASLISSVKLPAWALNNGGSAHTSSTETQSMNCNPAAGPGRSCISKHWPPVLMTYNPDAVLKNKQSKKSGCGISLDGCKQNKRLEAKLMCSWASGRLASTWNPRRVGLLQKEFLCVNRIQNRTGNRDTWMCYCEYGVKKRLLLLKEKLVCQYFNGSFPKTLSIVVHLLMWAYFS